MNLKDAFAGIQEAKAPKSSGAQEPRNLGTQAPKRRSTEAPRRLSLQNTAKSRHPEFEPVKVYLRKRTRRDAMRKWEDAAGGDFSDLVEMLLQKYLGA